jgi:hypothetical protein
MPLVRLPPRPYPLPYFAGLSPPRPGTVPKTSQRKILTMSISFRNLNNDSFGRVRCQVWASLISKLSGNGPNTARCSTQLVICSRHGCLRIGRRGNKRSEWAYMFCAGLGNASLHKGRPICSTCLDGSCPLGPTDLTQEILQGPFLELIGCPIKGTVRSTWGSTVQSAHSKKTE